MYICSDINISHIIDSFLPCTYLSILHLYKINLSCKLQLILYFYKNLSCTLQIHKCRIDLSCSRNLSCNCGLETYKYRIGFCIFADIPGRIQQKHIQMLIFPPCKTPKSKYYLPKYRISSGGKKISPKNTRKSSAKKNYGERPARKTSKFSTFQAASPPK